MTTPNDVLEFRKPTDSKFFITLGIPHPKRGQPVCGVVFDAVAKAALRAFMGAS